MQPWTPIQSASDVDGSAGSGRTQPRILVAGIGNIFLGDDAFGVEVVRRLGPQREGIRVVDFGIRGLDLAYALQDGYDLVILVDAVPRGSPPGTLFVLEPDGRDMADAGGLAIEGHGMDPFTVLRLARAMGTSLPPLRIVGCEPACFGSDEDPAMGLSAAVAAAVDQAVDLVQQMILHAATWRRIS